MKRYRDYFDSTTVSDALHRRILLYATRSGSTRRPSAPMRRIAAYACAAAVLIAAALFGVEYLPRPSREGTPSSQDVPGTSRPVVSPPASETAPEASGIPEYDLILNKAESMLSASVIIPGHFWRELTPEEQSRVFPGLSDMYDLRATVNFQSDDSGASLYSIDAHAAPKGGPESYIKIAPGEATVDYIIDGEIKDSDVLGTAVSAGFFETKPNSKGLKKVIYFASFKMSGLGYYVELGGSESEKEKLLEEFSSLVGLLIRGGPADVSLFDDPAVPELRNERMDLDQARSDPDFGMYLPASLPAGFSFESALRFIDQDSDYLYATWYKGLGYIDWQVSRFEEEDEKRLTSVEDIQNYDLALYPIPRAESVPAELRAVVSDPIFRIDDLTLDVVRARTYEVSDAGDEPGPRMKFGVLYGEILIELNVKGAAPEVIFELLRQIGK
jgi:hypothetical protein